MFAKNSLSFLLASPDPALLTALEPVLLACGAQVEVAPSLEAALTALSGAKPPTLALLDERLPALDPRMNMECLLAAARAQSDAGSAPVAMVLIADEVGPEWQERLSEGVLDDLIPRKSSLGYWRVRIDMVLRRRQTLRELDTFREAAAMNAQMDRLTGVCNRETILATLFRETDRVQRIKGALSLVLLDIDDFGHWNSRLGHETCDDLLCQVAGRMTRVLRSYDMLGRPGPDEFLLILPGCSVVNATTIAERIRIDVFCTPFYIAGESIRLSACFGIAASQGRSPVVVLREAEQALQQARRIGADTTRCYGESAELAESPLTVPARALSEGLLAW